MNTNLRAQLAQLDRSLVALLNERARLVARNGELSERASVDDLLRRSEGPFDAGALREVFRWIESGSRGGKP